MNSDTTKTTVDFEDADLFAWIVHRGEPDDPELKTIIARVLGNGMPRPELPPGAV